MRKIKKAIIILLIFIVSIIISILMLKFFKKEEKNDNLIADITEGEMYTNNDNGFQMINDPNIFFSVTNILNDYFMVLSYEDNIDDIQINKYNIKNEEEQKNIIMSLLSKEYINKNNINRQNIKQYVTDIKYNYNLIPMDIRVKYDENVIIYILNVYLEDVETLQLENRYYIIRMDNNNVTFDIEPVTDEIRDIDKIFVKNTENEILKNDYNSYNIETISTEGLIRIYMNQLISMMINHPDIAYNQYFEEEYKTKRFGSIEQFKKYIQENANELRNVIATKYLSEREGDIEKYVVLDQNQNTYEFYETATMLFNVKLDTYTIPSEKFISTYKKAKNQDKVMMNIDKWIQMLNNRDYKTAYSVLDENYKNNTFENEEQFESFMREKLPLHYEVEYSNFLEEKNIYSMDIKLTDITKESEEQKQMTIIMQLKDDLDFAMSFSFDE